MWEWRALSIFISSFQSGGLHPMVSFSPTLSQSTPGAQAGVGAALRSKGQRSFIPNFQGPFAPTLVGVLWTLVEG